MSDTLNAPQVSSVTPKVSSLLKSPLRFLKQLNTMAQVFIADTDGSSMRP